MSFFSWLGNLLNDKPQEVIPLELTEKQLTPKRLKRDVYPKRAETKKEKEIKNVFIIFCRMVRAIKNRDRNSIKIFETWRGGMQRLAEININGETDELIQNVFTVSEKLCIHSKSKRRDIIRKMGNISFDGERLGKKLTNLAGQLRRHYTRRDLTETLERIVSKVMFLKNSVSDGKTLDNFDAGKLNRIVDDWAEKVRFSESKVSKRIVKYNGNKMLFWCAAKKIRSEVLIFLGRALPGFGNTLSVTALSELIVWEKLDKEVEELMPKLVNFEKELAKAFAQRLLVLKGL